MRLIDNMWSYPSPDILGMFRKYDIKEPLKDLAKKDDYLLLVPTYAWDRAIALQKFLHDHYRLNTAYEVVMDPKGRACCYPNFTVLKFRTAPERPALQRD